jgi:Terminase large subunit, T4likevirus-type, N-terminal
MLAADDLLEMARRLDPVCLALDCGMTPDPWQEEVLRSTADRILMLASRQSGKSFCAAVLALHQALYEPGSLVLLLSPTLRQSGEINRDKVLRLFNSLGRPQQVVQESALTMQLATGSRIVSLPGEEGTIRGYSGVKLLVIDEAARVPDALYAAVRPMLAVSRGRLVALSSAYAMMGWFYHAWCGDQDWHRVKVTARQCPRISEEFLADELAELGPRVYGVEYLCEFGEATGCAFREEDITLSLRDAPPPLWSSGPCEVVGVGPEEDDDKAPPTLEQVRAEAGVR